MPNSTPKQAKESGSCIPVEETGTAYMTRSVILKEIYTILGSQVTSL